MIANAVMDMDQAKAWVIVGGVIATTLTGLGTMIVSIIVALRQGRTEIKVEEIKKSTDGTLSLAREALKIQQDRSAQLEQVIRSTPGAEVPAATKQTEQKSPPVPPEILLERLEEPLVPTTGPVSIPQKP